MRIHHGDCIEVMRGMADASVDSIVTDPPYGLGFMGKAWDELPPGEEWARECLRVLKPGAYLLAFGGTRTWHRLAVAVEDAGFEIRDSIAWMHGQGFPKGKAGLKPAHEPIVVGRKKPNAPRTGLLQIDACRVGTTVETWPATRARALNSRDMHHNYVNGGTETVATGPVPAGRWPANVVLSEDQAEALDEQSGVQRDGVAVNRNRGEFKPQSVAGAPTRVIHEDHGFGGSGGASRYFYVAKAGKRERPTVDGTAHPTVKPLALMRWLVRLVTPPGGTVLDPFAGSGTTIEAALLEGFQPIGIEREADYLPLIEARIARVADLPLDLPA